MNRRHAAPVGQRDRRKRDLLLASQLARAQAVGAFDELAVRTDAVAYRVMQVRAWLGSPLAWIVAGAFGTLVLRLPLRGGRAAQLLRWGWLAWRAWRNPGRSLPVR